MHGAERYQQVEDEQTEGSFDGTKCPRDSVCEDGCDGRLATCNRCGKHQQPLRHNDEFYKKNKSLEYSSTDLSSYSTRSRRSVLAEVPRSRFFRDWWLELVGCILIVGSVLAIFATAYSYQGHPLPAWPHDITINSLIAIYVVILKAAILLILAQGLSHLKWTCFTESRPLHDLARYDNASRGPLGSIGLLWSLRGRDLVSSAGALIIVAAVILDPMAQQIIRYWNCPQAVPDQNATIPRTNAYLETGLHVGAGISTIPVALQASINGGVFVPEASTVSWDCPSGNCTFSQTHFTMGFTSECEDVSDELTFQNVSATWSYIMWQQNPNGTSENIPQTITQNVTLMNSTLPSGLSTSYNLNIYDLTKYMVMAFNSSTYAFEIILGPPTQSPSALGNLCSGSDSTVNQSMSDWSCRGWGAARCKLLPAIYSVRSNITSGKLREIMSLETTELGYAGIADSAVDVSCLNTKQKSALADVGYVLPQADQPQWMPYNVSVSMSENNTWEYQSGVGNTTDSVKRIAPAECIYQMSSISVMSLDVFFIDYFDGAIVPSGSEWTGSSVAQQFYNNHGVNFERVDSMFRNISKAMTTHVRENGYANNSAPALGQVWHTETCIRVRWPLLTFPAVLAVSTITFFIAMILETKRAQHGVHHDFKSSPLALLFHGLDEQAQKRLVISHLGESNEVQDLNHEAKNMHVQLRPTEQGWRFVTEGQKPYTKG